MSRKDEEILETRHNVAIRAGYKCEICGKAVPFEEGQLAHRIPQRKHLIEKFGAGVIHHPLNFRWTCPTDRCNSAASIGSEKEQKELARYIREQILVDASARILLAPHLHTSLINKLAKVANGESA